MEKRKITAREMLKDIRAGLSDQDLMEKYSLSAQGLQSVFAKLVQAGAVTQTELDDRISFGERTVDLGLFICPACGNIQGKEFTQCPRCSFINTGKPITPPEPEKPSLRKQPTTTVTTAVTEVVPVRTTEPPPTETRIRPVITNIEVFDKLSAVVSQCKALSIAVFVGYLFVYFTLLIVTQFGEGFGVTPATQSLIFMILLGIPAIITGLFLFVVMRALGDAVNLFLEICGSLVGKNPRG